ncbi:MAG: TrkA family potassium uptake protein [Methanomicrobium sp.]|nr:TrkA family potassium uptake protein [Methanomicrobium sp.]MBR6448120.1 TrkA family potassium uptake protein [Methanomicrobium sp.]MBR6497682.1 TrkA family potassium uptake protein [Methanomicrobium sp.]
MYIIVVGLGGIGRSLVGIAAEHGDSVAVVDINEGRCNEIVEHYDVMAVVGNATEKAILEDAGIDRADALVTATADDAVNLMACWIAKRYKVANVASIVNQPGHSDLFKEVGVMISENPDELVATRLYHWSGSPDMQQLATIPGGTIFEMTVDEGAPCVDREIRQMTIKDFVFIAINRVGKELIIPNGLIKLKANDKVTVFTKKEAEAESFRSLTEQMKVPRKTEDEYEE